MYLVNMGHGSEMGPCSEILFWKDSPWTDSIAVAVGRSTTAPWGGGGTDQGQVISTEQNHALSRMEHETAGSNCDGTAATHLIWNWSAQNFLHGDGALGLLSTHPADT